MIVDNGVPLCGASTTVMATYLSSTNEKLCGFYNYHRLHCNDLRLGGFYLGQSSGAACSRADMSRTYVQQL